MNTPASKSRWPRRVLLRLGSIWVGLGLLALILVYLALATIPAELFWINSSLLTKPLSCDQMGLYGHPLFAGLCVALCVSLTLATILRIPLRLAHLGGWLAHGSIILLAVGSIYFATHHARGYAVTHYDPKAETWSPITELYREDTLAVNLFPADATAPPAETALPGRLEGEANQLFSPGIPIAGAPAGVTAEAIAYRRDVVLTPMLSIEIVIDGASETVAISGRIDDQQAYRSETLSLAYLYDPDANWINGLIQMWPKMKHERDAAFVLYAPGISFHANDAKNDDPILMILHPNGQRTMVQIAVGRETKFEAYGKKLTLRPKSFYHQAQTQQAKSPDGPEQMERPAAGAVELKIHAGDWTTTTCVPLTGAIYRAGATSILLPNQQRLRVQALPQRTELGATMTVQTAKIETYPGTVLPSDYVAKVAIEQAGKTREETIDLNNPVLINGYQFYNANWSPQPGQGPVQMIQLGFASRPAIGLIWLSFALLSLSLPYAFYVKPLLLRKRRTKMQGERSSL